MSDKFIEFLIEDENHIILGIEKEANSKRRLARDMVDHLGTFGLSMLQFNVPVHSSYLLRHAAKSEPKFKAGGAGGGGDYEVIVGIKAGTSKHPFYVEFGTGLYGPVGWYITPVSALSMTWFSTVYGRRISKKFTRGQKPQRYLYETWKEVEVYARMQLIGKTINPLR